MMGVESVNEQDGAGDIADPGHHPLQPLEIAAVAGPATSAPRSSVKMRAPFQGFGHLAFDDAQRQPLGDGGLANAGLADQHRVVLGPAAQDLDGAGDRVVTADDRIDLSGRRPRIEVDAPGRQRAVGDRCCRFHRFRGIKGLARRLAPAACRPSRWTICSTTRSRVTPWRRRIAAVVAPRSTRSARRRQAPSQDASGLKRSARFTVRSSGLSVVWRSGMRGSSPSTSRWMMRDRCRRLSAPRRHRDHRSGRAVDVAGAP